MSVSSGFRKYRKIFAPFSRLAATLNNHPESAMMGIPRVVESQSLGCCRASCIVMITPFTVEGQLADSGLLFILSKALGDIQVPDLLR
jgi:hypothetical protein